MSRITCRIAATPVARRCGVGWQTAMESPGERVRQWARDLRLPRSEIARGSLRGASYRCFLVTETRVPGRWAT